ncbi:hypothetical protein F5B22DRAFT_649743 [Xylaria bambusicola]|uniref:uncharacterized protein n=1 Tax=Xylaria bambusicola TaxID=326684 RepID=UPI0020088AC0|nr:uncharacterized protein F5B22DRAFT_649743 [Xylaria bambusicola]KAI0508649.1 hypothetical protein F5B22DRAFT_649743 [Xylaria bambusicola]
MEIDGASKVSGQAIKGAEYIKDFFGTRPDREFIFERIISQGSWGFTVQMMMKSNETPETISPSPLSQALGLQPLTLQPPAPPRPFSSMSRGGPSFGSQFQIPRGSQHTTRFVMKRSLTEAGESNITKEIDLLNRLRGSMHIAQPSHVIDNPRWNSILPFLNGPTLVMDWIENGLLWTFYERRAQVDEPLPNRLLWALFLCLCRMVVALTWPPRDLGLEIHGGLSIEGIPPRNLRGERPPKARLLHGDFHGQNIMIDQLEPYEHNSVPVLKLIDFGLSRDLPARPNEPKDIVMKTNIRAIGEVMLGLIRGNVKGGPGMMEITYKGETKRINSFATDLDRLSNKYRAPAIMVAKHQDRIANLDPDIRSLVASCVAVGLDDRPDIEDLLNIVERNAKNKTPNDYTTYKYSANETDAAIKKIIDAQIFGASGVVTI